MDYWPAVKYVLPQLCKSLFQYPSLSLHRISINAYQGTTNTQSLS